MLGTGKDAEETPEYHLEPGLLVLQWNVWWWWRLADDERELRDEVDNELPMRTQRLLKSNTPIAQLPVALAENLGNETLESLSDRGIRDISFVLVEFA